MSSVTSAPPLTVNEVLTSVLQRTSDPEPPSSSVPTVSAAALMADSVTIGEIGLLEAVTESQLCFDTNEEAHGGEADPPLERRKVTL